VRTEPPRTEPPRTGPPRGGKARKRIFAVLALLGGWAVLAVGGATPALAHATIAGSDPADSSRLQAAPSKVTMSFSEDVSVGAGFLKVVDGKGNTVSSGNATTNGRDVSVRMQSGLKDGSYIVSYRIVSADSHPISGAYAFVVGDGPLVAATGSVLGGSTDSLVSDVFTVARWISFVGIVLFGGLAFLVLCWPRGRTDPLARKLIWYGWWGTTIGALLGLILQGPYAAGTGLLDVLNTGLLKTTLGTTYGRMLCGRLVLLGVLAVLTVRILREPSRTAEKSRARDEDLAAICGLGVLATYGGVGHAAAGSTPTLALLSDTTHLAAASVWLGGLVILAACLLPRRRTGELAEALPRFSKLALGCVAALTVTGTYQAWREIWPIPALWHTSYGQILIAKITGFLLIVAVAYFSRQAVRRRYVTPVVHALSVKEDDGSVATIGEPEAEAQAVDGDQRMVRRLRISVGIELLLGICVLGLAAVLVATAPARSTYVRPVDQTVRLASGGTAKVDITPVKVGANTLRINVFDAQGKPVDAKAVTGTLALPAQQYGPLAVQVNRVGTGQYVTASAALPKPGDWELVVRVQMSEFDRDVAQVNFKVT
jgi:copper transport protein